MIKMVNGSSRYGGLAGALIVAAAISLTASVLVAQHLYLNYSLNNNYISDLGVGSTAPIFNTTIIFFGALLVLAALVMLMSRQRYRALAFLVAGIGGMCVGLFPETTGLPHIIAATVAFGSVSVSALGFTKVFKGKAVYYTLASGILGLAIILLFIPQLLGVRINIGLGKGGFEEILFYNEVIWALVVGASILLKRI
ncbi:MAG: DUF998 domain-containing protein [Candidatus Micrarchaeota archaeon]|nr:DUF998 domain-containing protein [Candidatus Micrarchaeota archaeon]